MINRIYKMAINKADLIENPDWQLWKDDNLAFIKQDIFEGKSSWMIYDAYGERIAAVETKEFAFWVAKQNDLEPYCVC